eukprot:NODE_22841_length_692_cov_3.341593.p6 GENE.NODE_22841_length_692_cov_3.341593~~NODE_22841_length_692_cov_3.341593.p6  ORF type:complete len:74 (+),score=35.00 NODE_22841_length_692_cov_3.341593:469-690(+)
MFIATFVPGGAASAPSMFAWSRRQTGTMSVHRDRRCRGVALWYVLASEKKKKKKKKTTNQQKTKKKYKKKKKK